MKKLAGKIAVITGAASGIGRASAILFAREGAAVVVADIDASGGEETAGHIRAAGGEAAFVRADVAQADSVEAMIAATVARYDRLDVAFNNAGIGGEFGMIADCSEENFDRVVAVNLKGVFFGMKYAIRAMLGSSGGVIVNTASVAGLVGTATFPAYAAAKGGVIQLTKTAAVEYARQGIRVNCICPGVVDTPILAMIPPAVNREAATGRHPMARMGRPEEIARAALFLASDDSSFATGAALVVDGGFTAE